MSGLGRTGFPNPRLLTHAECERAVRRSLRLLRTPVYPDDFGYGSGPGAADAQPGWKRQAND